jgi:hypothetical protein
MSTQPSPPPGARTLAEFCALAELGDEARALLTPAHRPREFVELLAARGLFPDAVRFLAHALPKREGIWWAWVCAKRADGDTPPPVRKAALDATERWITQPTDENRRAAMRAAEAATFGTAAGCTALAVFFSGGSLGPPDQAVVPPGEFLSAKALTGAVKLAAVSTEPEKAPEKFRGFIAQGLDVVSKLRLWGEA